MKQTICFLLAAALLMIGSAGLLIRDARANDQPLYTIDFWTIDGGGARVSGENSYTLQGTTGQADAGWVEQGEYRLVAGFWGSFLAPQNIYLPLLVR